MVPEQLPVNPAILLIFKVGLINLQADGIAFGKFAGEPETFVALVFQDLRPFRRFKGYAVNTRKTRGYKSNIQFHRIYHRN